MTHRGRKFQHRYHCPISVSPAGTHEVGGVGCSDSPMRLHKGSLEFCHLRGGGEADAVVGRDGLGHAGYLGGKEN